MYVVLALIATGDERLTCCRPEAVSPKKAAVAGGVPVPVHSRAGGVLPTSGRNLAPGSAVPRSLAVTAAGVAIRVAAPDGRVDGPDPAQVGQRSSAGAPEGGGAWAGWDPAGGPSECPQRSWARADSAARFLAA